MSRQKTVALVRVPYSVVYSVFGRLPKHREIRPPLGLAYLAGSLRKEGIASEIIDAEVELLSVEAIVNRVKDFPYVGLTATTPDFHMVSAIARRLKKLNPSVTTVVGGPHPSAVATKIAEEYPWFDYIIIGEGEEVFPRIIKDTPRDKIINATPIPNIDKIPLPAKDMLDYQPYRYPFAYKGLLRIDAILSSRGCPYECSFCFKTFKGKLRFRDIVSVVNEIEWMHRDKKVESFLFFDDTFTFSKERVEQFCRELKKRRLKLYFYCFTRADIVTKDMLKLMKESGFIKITMGAESGNQNILDSINKRVQLDQVRSACKWMQELSIEARTSFIIGLPHESAKEVRDSINFAKELNIHTVGFNILTPYPGTDLYKKAKQGNCGLRLLCEDWSEFRRWGNAVVETPYLTREDLIRLQKQALQEFYLRPRIIWYYLKQFFHLKHRSYYYRPLMSTIKSYLHEKWSGREPV